MKVSLAANSPSYAILHIVLWTRNIQILNYCAQFDWGLLAKFIKQNCQFCALIGNHSRRCSCPIQPGKNRVIFQSKDVFHTEKYFLLKKCSWQQTWLFRDILFDYKYGHKSTGPVTRPHITGLTFNELFISELRWDWLQITLILIFFNEISCTRLSDGTFVCYIVAIGERSFWDFKILAILVQSNI